MSSPKLLLGPGPSNPHPRVLAALSRPLLGHLDPAFLAILDEAQARLRTLFGTQNPLTLPLSATGSGGMEACLANLLEPGDSAVIGVAGVFGERMCEVARRIGARVERVETEPGTALPAEAMADAIESKRPRVVAFVHAETSTGVLQPVDEIAAAARRAEAFLRKSGQRTPSSDPPGGRQPCISLPVGQCRSPALRPRSLPAQYDVDPREHELELPSREASQSL
jgi:alanine-glyoxylate transaminase/serine-glyoxylate transaminase/serine-pyruvate transaminase